MYESSAVVTSEPPHILFLSPVDLQLSLILCLFHLYLPLSGFIVSFLSQVCRNPLASTPPFLINPLLCFFSRLSPTPPLFCLWFFVFPPEQQPEAELFSPRRPICSQETQWTDVLARLIRALQVSASLSLFHADLKAAVSSGHFMCVSMSK